MSRLVARYRAEGEAAFEPRSRRPRTSPHALPAGDDRADLELRTTLTEQRPRRRRAHHRLAPRTPPRRARCQRPSISRHLPRPAGHTQRRRNARSRSYIRFAAELPNERWQADFTHWRLADGTHVEILCWLDDHSRYALSVTAHRRVTGPVVVDAFRKAVAATRHPASTLTDNGMVFTTRLSGGSGGRNGFEDRTARLGVVQINSTPNHPTTCGKVERFHQTLKKWLTAQPTRRPPSPNCKPNSTPSSTNTTTADRTAHCRTRHPRHRLHQPAPKPPRPATRLDTHDRVRTDRVDDAGVRHPAPRRPPAPHRHRPNPRPNPRPHAHPGPRHPHHQRRHRRTPPRPNPRPHQGLPTHRRPQRPEKAPNLSGSGLFRCLATSHCAPGRIRTCDTSFCSSRISPRLVGSPKSPDSRHDWYFRLSVIPAVYR